MIQITKDRKVLAIRHAESEALFTSIGDGAISTDGKGNITRINKTAGELLGINNDVIGLPMCEVVVAVDDNNNKIPNSDRPLNKVFKDKKTRSQKMIYRRRRQTDPLLHVLTTVSPIILKNKIIGAIIIFKDVSDDYKIEQMKNDFISLASHQLRTPLTSVITYSHMLLDGYMGDLDEGQRNFIKTIVKSSNRMNGVIGSLMDISKIDNGAIKFNPILTDITQILEGVVHENRIELEDKNITYTNSSDKNNRCVILNDPILLTEIINNLVSNAIKYTPKGGSITAKVEHTEVGARIKITDNGIGIQPKHQKQIFNKFFRAPGITKHETEGSGLGLYIVKGFLDIIGGDIRFKSEEGKGTTFELIIPNISTGMKIKYEK
jgi:PAS domain S-box-containing protein